MADHLVVGELCGYADEIGMPSRGVVPFRFLVLAVHDDHVWLQTVDESRPPFTGRAVLFAHLDAMEVAA